MSGQYETCRNWLAPAPLEPGKTHCPYCLGYGILPIDKSDNITRFYPPSCWHCSGTGKN